MKEKMMKNMGYFIALLDISIYFILSYVYVDNFQNNILATIINSSLLFIGAIVANSALMKQGILNGRDNEKYKETLKSHISQKQKIYPKIKFLQPWLDSDYYTQLRIRRTIYVNSAGYDYDELFTDKGKVIQGKKVDKPKPIKCESWWKKLFSPILRLFRWIFSDDWKVYRQNKKFIKKAKRCKITRQTVSYLINIDQEEDPNDFGITEKQYTKKQTGTAVVTRLFFSVLLQSVAFGFYGFNMETFIVQLLSIVLVLIGAFSSMFSSYFFMVKTHRETILKKINKLEEFDNVDLAKFGMEIKKEKETKQNEICSKVSKNAESDLMEEIHSNCESRETNNLSSQSNIGV